MKRACGIFSWGLIVRLMLAIVSVAASRGLAQADELSLAISPSGPGVQGFYRLGQLTPLSVTIDHAGFEPRRVIVQWAMADADGDRVLYRRAVTLTPQSRQSLWLYGQPVSMPRPTGDQQQEVAVYDSTGSEARLERPGRLLVRQIVPSGQDPTTLGQISQAGSMRSVGILGSADLGLAAYLEPWAQQQGCLLIRGLHPASLPDRGDGLAMFQTLVWSVGAFSSQELHGGWGNDAIRQWVRHGGHLVIVLPPWGYQTIFQSPLADVLPVSLAQVHRQDGLTMQRLPSWLGVPNHEDETLRLASLWFDVESSADGSPSVLLRDRDERPAVIAHSHGLGRVTLIGLDLNDGALRRLGLPSSLTQAADPVGLTLWPTVLGWRGPVFSAAFLESQKGKRIRDIQHRRRHDLSVQAIDPWTTMQATVATVMLLSILVMSLYWILAGPLLQVITKKKGIPQHNWLAFLLVVLLFSLIAWGGAWLLLPGRSQATSLVIIDSDALSGQSRLHAWGALYVPQHRRATLALAQADRSGSVQHGASRDEVSVSSISGDSGWITGLASGLGGMGAAGAGGIGGGGGGFVDSQEYVRDMTRLDRWSPVLRSTAKPFELEHWSPLVQATASAPDWRSVPTGRIAWRNRWPVGRLTHHLPDDLQDVLLVYCPGDGQMPQVQRVRLWKAHQPLEIDRPLLKPLVVEPMDMFGREPSDRLWSGHLGDLMRGQSWQDNPAPGQAAWLATLPKDRQVAWLELMSFHGTLPPPDVADLGFPGPVHLDRSMGQELDITRWLALRRMIVLGHCPLEDAAGQDVSHAGALPLTLEGRPVSGRSWVMVRWILPLE